MTQQQRLIIEYSQRAINYGVIRDEWLCWLFSNELQMVKEK